MNTRLTIILRFILTIGVMVLTFFVMIASEVPDNARLLTIPALMLALGFWFQTSQSSSEKNGVIADKLEDDVEPSTLPTKKDNTILGRASARKEKEIAQSVPNS